MTRAANVRNVTLTLRPPPTEKLELAEQLSDSLSPTLFDSNVRTRQVVA